MAEKFEEIAVVVDQSSLGNGIYDITLKTDKIAKAAKAGQFVSVYSNDKSKLLPRPISLCGINRDDDTIRLVYRVTGEGTGTEEFSKLVRGDKVRILGPLGNGFTVQPGKKAFLIGGGIGGSIMAVMKVAAKVPELSGIPLAFITTRFPLYFVGLFASYAAGFIVCRLMGFKDPEG